MSPEKEGGGVASHRNSLIQKSNSLLKASARNVGYRAESLSLPRLVIDHGLSSRSNNYNSNSNSKSPATGLRKSSAPAVYRSRAGSTSSPSISSPPSQEDHQLRHSPSFPSNDPVVRPAFSYYSLWRVRPDPANSTPLSSIPPEKLLKLSEMGSLTVNTTSLKRVDELRSPSVPDHILNYSAGGYAGGFSGSSVSLSSGIGANPGAIYQHIQEMSAKRISTLTYLRKAHEGRVYWFNTLLFTKTDLLKLPSFEPKRLARRATNFLLLGLSLPPILDNNSSNAIDYLRALNAILVEFEAYQQVHPTDGSTSSSLSRARIPRMFSRTHTVTKGRRTSSAAEIGLPMNTSDPADLKSMTSNNTSSSANASVISFGTSEQELLPGEEYAHLLTPSLPFDPDFFETFATLCEILIDCYSKIATLVSSPASCVPNTYEIFNKADARIRKLLVANIVKEFEEAGRSGVKSEVAGIGKVVLGGLL
ncbi:MAG: hypothetical protein MMC33_005376 [Icmadophila ericetorum]|nr:hypothetical protein [Icmadophila ericetorum]